MRKVFYDYKRVAALREHMGLTRRQMADALGVTYMTVSRAEKGICSIELLAKIALLFGVSLDSLVLDARQIVKNFARA
jgi:transcriptional regulator with XRE-family HTH domain